MIHPQENDLAVLSVFLRAAVRRNDRREANALAIRAIEQGAPLPQLDLSRAGIESLKHIPVLGTRVPVSATPRRLVVWAADCAEHALSAFDEVHPSLSGPRTAVGFARRWPVGGNTRDPDRACYAGQLAVTNSAAYAAYSAAFAAYAARAAHSGERTNAAVYAVCSAADARAAAGADKKEHTWQSRRLIKILLTEAL